MFNPKSLLHNPLVYRGGGAVLTIIVITVVVRFLQNFLVKRVADSASSYRIRKVIGFFGVIAAIIIICIIFSSVLPHITVAFGLVGAGVAVALRGPITSVIGWVVIIFAGYYKTGDRIEIASFKGDVIDIGIMRTTLMEIGQWVKSDLYNGRILHFSNNMIFTHAVFNYSGDFPFLWDEMILPVKYGGDYITAGNILYQAAKETVGELTSQATERWKGMMGKYLIHDTPVEPLVTLIATDNWVEFTLRYVVDYKKRRVTKDKIFRYVLQEIAKTNNRVEIASGTYAVVQMPPLNVVTEPQVRPDTK
jgi:small-conductance mechanosensitive channel